MPSFRVAIQGKTYEVEIPDPGATPLQVVVDGQPFEVVISDAGKADLIGAPSFTPPPAVVPTPSRPAPPPVRPVPAATGPGGRAVDAPLPGTVLAIEVSVGQEVKAGQILLVLEAMKMKNPIRASHDGRVAEVCVQPGQTVLHGAVLIRLD